MMFPFADTESDDITEEEYVPKEYGIDFKTGQLSGKIVEGVDALMVWCWIALHTPRYRYYIYSDEYGQEFEDLIGKQYSEGYTNSELERMTEECLCVNPYIEGITDFECVKKDEKIMLSFKLITTVIWMRLLKRFVALQIYGVFLLQINTQKVVLILRHHLFISLIMSILMMKAGKRLQMYGLMR